jgi:protoporphyrinogen/coproporphyrinogen III oxidase
MSGVVVVGGGIAGLAAAWALASAGIDDITICEAGSRWGGKIAAADVGGVRLDAGAESLLARRPEAVDLIAELGLADRLVHPTEATSRVLVEGRPRPLPPSAMGVPRDLDQLEGFLSPRGLLRARQEPDLPAPPLAGDVGIGALVDDRFGAEVTDRLLEPLLGGVYAGNARDLSFQAVAPALFQRARHGGSLVRHAAELTDTTASGPVFAGLQGGLSGLVETLLTKLAQRGATLRRSVTVRELSRGAGKFRLLCGAVPHPQLMDADAVILAAPAAACGRLLSTVLAVDQAFVDIPYASMAVVTLVVQAAEISGSGLLVPPGELPTIKALTNSSLKWEWVDDTARLAWGPGTAVVRASVGRLGEARLLQVGNDALLRRTFEEAKTLPGWARARLVTGSVQRWGGGLPQYLVGHRDMVGRVRSSVAGVPGLAVCGAAFDGVGIAACVGSARAAAAKVLSDLAGDAGRIGVKTDGRTETQCQGLFQQPAGHLHSPDRIERNTR